MGDEITSGTLSIKKFLGLNLLQSDMVIDIREASALQNYFITESSLQQRFGSTLISSNDFTEKTDTTAKPITSLYSTSIVGAAKQVGTGGDAFKEFTAGAWVDYTGAITLTDDPDNLVSYATFFDSANDEVLIGASETAGDTRFKWTGVGDAVALTSTPGDFKYPVVHYNKLWVAVDDYVYLSGLNNCESWDVAWDVVRFRGRGEPITGLAKYAGRMIVFKKSSIHAISGSSYGDMYSEEIVSEEGCVSGYTIREIESRRYGNILVFLSKEGILKGFNGSKNLLTLGSPVKPLYDAMNRSRDFVAVGENYKKRKQYWLSMSYGSDSTHSQIMVYDYWNDIYTSEDGLPLSTNLYYTGINANAIGLFNTSSNQEYLVTGDYDGVALRQDNGLLDEETDLIESKWSSKKMDLGDPTFIKMMTDMTVVTTQTSETHLETSVATPSNSSSGTSIIPVAGALWGSMIWGTGLWSAENTVYTRVQQTPTVEDESVAGRYFIIQLNHSTINEAVNIEELEFSYTNLGKQPEYVET